MAGTSTDPGFDELVRWVSAERMAPYRSAVGNDTARAARLYRWNSAVSAALFEELGHFEVVLRNAMHSQLRDWHRRHKRPGEWYDDPAKLLGQHRHDDILQARQRIQQRRGTETPGKVVAELNLGFWRFLLDQRHQQILWAQALNRAFPGMAKRRRSDVQQRVNRLHKVRNRIAHHEPIYGEDLASRHDEIIEIVGWIDNAAAQWLARTCTRVPILLAHRP